MWEAGGAGREQGWVGWARGAEGPQTPWLSRKGRAQRQTEQCEGRTWLIFPSIPQATLLTTNLSLKPLGCHGNRLEENRWSPLAKFQLIRAEMDRKGV